MFDVCVVGAGPAGSILALRLAHLGHKVSIIEKCSFPRPHVGESLTGGVLPLLDIVGLRGEFEQSGFLPAPWATVLWAGELRNRETPGGYQVDRARFDSMLLDAARRAGAAVWQPNRLVDARTQGGKWELRLDSGQVLHARYLADAGGRTSRLASSRKTALGPRTFAMFAYWKNAHAGDGETLVEAGREQWYWGAPLPDRSFVACVFVNPGQARTKQYEALIKASALLGPRLQSAIHGDVRVCDATPYADTTPVTESFIKVGDASLSIDPLSSQGTQTAMGTALHAAAVIHTMFDRPGHAALAMDFYRRRVSDSAHFHARTAAAFYHGPADLDEDVRAFLSPDRPVRVSPRISFVRMPAVAGPYIVEIEGIEYDGNATAFAGETRVADLLRLVNGSAMPARDVVQRWSHRMGTTGALQFLQWAWQRGWITGGEDSPA